MKKQIENPKIVIVTRKDLPNAGAFVAQSLHAAFEFSLQHSQTCKEWHVSSNYVACLEVDSEQQLLNLVTKLQQNNVKHSLFYEPDYNNEATSVCIEPGVLTRKFTSNFRLAFKNTVPVVPIGRMPGRLTQEACGFEPHREHLINQKQNHHENNVDCKKQQKSVVSFIFDQVKQLNSKIKTKLWKQ